MPWRERQLRSKNLVPAYLFLQDDPPFFVFFSWNHFLSSQNALHLPLDRGFIFAVDASKPTLWFHPDENGSHFLYFCLVICSISCSFVQLFNSKWINVSYAIVCSARNYPFGSIDHFDSIGFLIFFNAEKDFFDWEKRLRGDWIKNKK